jgi:hypothetical protein
MLLNSRRRGCLGRSEKRKFATLHVLRRPLWPQLRERIYVRVMCCVRDVQLSPLDVLLARGNRRRFDFQIAFFLIRIARCKSALDVERRREKLLAYSVMYIRIHIRVYMKAAAC